MKRLVAGLLALACSLSLFGASWSWTAIDPLISRYRVRVDGENGDWIYVKDGVRSYTSQSDALVLQYSHDGESFSGSLVFPAKPGSYEAYPISMEVKESPETIAKPTNLVLAFAGGSERTITTGEYGLYEERDRWEFALDASWKNLWRNAGFMLGGSSIPARIGEEGYPTFTVSAMGILTFPANQYEIDLGLGGFSWFWTDGSHEGLTKQMYGLQTMLRYTYLIGTHWFCGFDVLFRYYAKSRFFHEEAGRIVSEAPEDRNGGAMTFAAHAVVGYRF